MAHSFGGRALDWIDEKVYTNCYCQLNNDRIITRSMIGVEFTSCAIRGDIVEIGMETVKMGTTSMTIRCDVRNKHTEEKITKDEAIIF
jgi:acyl-CoA hydrolase